MLRRIRGARQLGSTSFKYAIPDLGAKRSDGAYALQRTKHGHA